MIIIHARRIRRDLRRSRRIVARKLKTYQTSQGFFDLAIAAPSMKAALEAWGANSNLFHQGFAKEADDPKVIAATMAKPGIVLRRPVGTKEPFGEHAHLPTTLVTSGHDAQPDKPHRKIKEPAAGKVVDKAARKAALLYEQEERRRQSERRRQEAAEAKRREDLERAIAKAEADFASAEQDHAAKVVAIEKDRAAVDKRSQAEEERWAQLRERLKDALRKAKD
jgi:colicin import membrane protein